ncbi:MAG: hypothetical protein M1840_006991 [Geoglossum simile]|nr:MAG: hypothetical protein M1840_006991 [Geoglossum simile]
MVKGGRAAPAYRNAPPAASQVVRGLGDQQPVLGHHLNGVVGDGRVRGHLVSGLRAALNPIRGWFRQTRPHNQPEKLSQTKYNAIRGHDVRIDQFPWLDLDNPQTIRNSPVDTFIQQMIASRDVGALQDDFNYDNYIRYLDDYDCQYGRDIQATLEDAGGSPEDNAPQAGHIQGGKRKRVDNLGKTAKRRRPLERLTQEEWVTRERGLQDHLWSINRFYDIIPPNTIYIALDCKGTKILSVFPNGLDVAYGTNQAKQVIDNISYNIGEYARSQPPPAVHDIRHIHHRQWVQKNPHLASEDGCCGVYHWGTWTETGKDHKVIPTKETLKGGTRSNPSDGCHAFSYRVSTMKSFGPLTAAVDLLFSTIDPKLHKAYRAAYQRLDPGERIFCTTEDPKKELFPLRAILVNTLTEPHVDSDDWIGGWAWISPFGNFSGGDLCLPQLGVRVPLPPGGIAGLRGRELVHFTDKWSGSRYSIVHFFKESIRRCVQKYHQLPVTMTTTTAPLSHPRKISHRIEKKKRYLANRVERVKVLRHHNNSEKKARVSVPIFPDMANKD